MFQTKWMVCFLKSLCSWVLPNKQMWIKICFYFSQTLIYPTDNLGHFKWKYIYSNESLTPNPWLYEISLKFESNCVFIFSLFDLYTSKLLECSSCASNLLLFNFQKEHHVLTLSFYHAQYFFCCWKIWIFLYQYTICGQVQKIS